MIIQSLHACRLLNHILLGVLLLVVTGSLWNNKTKLVKATKQWWLSRTTRLMGITVEVKGTLPYREKEKGLLFVSNHVSWIDIPLIGGLQQLNFLSKAEVRNWPLIGKLAEGTGTLFIERGRGDTHKVAKDIANYINEGRSVLFFPEGTTSDGRSVRRFHPKLFRSAEHTPIDLCPLAIHYRIEGDNENPVAFIDDDEFTSHLWNLLRYRNIKATVEFLPVRPVRTENINQYVKSVQKEITDAVSTNTQWLDASNLSDPIGEATNFYN